MMRINKFEDRRQKIKKLLALFSYLLTGYKIVKCRLITYKWKVKTIGEKRKNSLSITETHYFLVKVVDILSFHEES